MSRPTANKKISSFFVDKFIFLVKMLGNQTDVFDLIQKPIYEENVKMTNLFNRTKDHYEQMAAIARYNGEQYLIAVKNPELARPIHQPSFEFLKDPFKWLEIRDSLQAELHGIQLEFEHFESMSYEEAVALLNKFAANDEFQIDFTTNSIKIRELEIKTEYIQQIIKELHSEFEKTAQVLKDYAELLMDSDCFTDVWASIDQYKETSQWFIKKSQPKKIKTLISKIVKEFDYVILRDFRQNVPVFTQDLLELKKAK